MSSLPSFRFRDGIAMHLPYNKIRKTFSYWLDPHVRFKVFYLFFRRHLCFPITVFEHKACKSVLPRGNDGPLYTSSMVMLDQQGAFQ